MTDTEAVFSRVNRADSGPPPKRRTFDTDDGMMSNSDWIAVRAIVSLSIVKRHRHDQLVRKSMSTISNHLKNRVPVGKTPVPRYASWDEHRDVMHAEAEARRTAMEQRLGQTAR
ncbi:hypothetical protein [Salinigranum salinum]|uniref:hypothetical protein n=1 Tax=Salinigranum salinum TaxID=1364937 RepID=UPI0012609DC5|nr:hypothetical protein [Salinigranum salinum]